MSGSNLSEGIWCGWSIFSNTKKLENSNKKVKSYKNLLMRYERKKSKTEKKQKVYFMPKSIEYAHRKCEKVITHKK